MTLRDILSDLKKFVGDAVNNLNPPSQAEFERDLEEIRSELFHGIEDTQKEYRRLVHKFYQIHKPFNTGNLEQDLAEYRQLIVHSLAAGDSVLFSFSKKENVDDGNICLIDKWGVEFPGENPTVLAKESLSYYSELFGFLCKDNEWRHFRDKYNLPDGAKIYYEYLVRKLSK
jgi:hypothetical protein